MNQLNKNDFENGKDVYWDSGFLKYCGLHNKTEGYSDLGEEECCECFSNIANSIYTDWRRIDELQSQLIIEELRYVDEEELQMSKEEDN